MAAYWTRCVHGIVPYTSISGASYVGYWTRLDGRHMITAAPAIIAKLKGAAATSATPRGRTRFELR